jgi:Raf kinase inhibitor-like YbhB/YbcL family protein
MKALAFSLALLAGSGLAFAASAQAPAGPQPPNAINLPDLAGKAKLTVTSNEIKDGQLIPNDNSSWGKSMSPSVMWTKGPAGTKSYAVLMEDADAHTGNPDIPITHWLTFNIPATATSLPAGLPPQGTAARPAGQVDGANITTARGGKPGYFGPRTPAKATHHYHLEVLALDTVLPLTEGASRPAFTDAAKGHVLASGEIVGLFTGPDAPPAPAAAPAAK